MQKRTLSIILILFIFSNYARSQSSGTIIVRGDFDKYYPVLFQDAEWDNNKATEVEIGRSNVHIDATWRGSEIAKFRYHTYHWGTGSNFIDADIRNYNPTNTNTFIAGWADVTTNNSNSFILIWLRGGTTTYYYRSPSSINPVVYDGVQNVLPYQETNGPARTYKTSIDDYVNFYGLSAGTAYYTGTSNNYFAGNVGIGISDTKGYKLGVNGTIHSKSVLIDLNGWNDYVFKKDYRLPSLSEVKAYIDQNQHLPDIPSEREMIKNGLDVSEMNKLLMKKVEELTLYLIEEDKIINEQQKKLSDQGLINKVSEERLKRLESLLPLLKTNQ